MCHFVNKARGIEKNLLKSLFTAEDAESAETRSEETPKDLVLCVLPFKLLLFIQEKDFLRFSSAHSASSAVKKRLPQILPNPRRQLLRREFKDLMHLFRLVSIAHIALEQHGELGAGDGEGGVILHQCDYRLD